ncbi:GntR family transcriptional regulator [Leucobacter weissii]|uniref:GntR family transcriptional regulator n=1 Tax=Leucobacter weissii TaxID=1983706 RepID=A0A939SB71_9MICO|nr:GntR family transcriptional regulator [Leucobacter weissii]MBO1902697.1 GntR family transcriptional regulator [Leucobacter weissii]
MTALQPRRMTDQVVRVLRERIVAGALAAGRRIDINEIAAELGVSQTPVREAILQLEALGLVTRQPYRGSVVAGIDPNRLEEVTALRIDLEGRATLLGVPRLSEADVDRMRELHAALAAYDRAHRDEAARRSDGFNRLNREFHGVVYAAADSPTLLRIIGVLQDEADRMRLRVDMRRPTAEAFHAQILDACERRDPQAACEATRRHLLESYLAIRGASQPPETGMLADVIRDSRMETKR